MLVSLSVNNLALVEKARLDFCEGLNVITGETGAGKSVLIGALSLVLGERADKGSIRTGENQCSVEAVFNLRDPDRANLLLEELALQPAEDGQLIVRRVIKANGAGQMFINDQTVSLQTLKRLGELLVDMHGPYDHQSLLSNDAQLELLDAFAGLAAARATFEEEHAKLRAIEDREAELAGGGGEGLADQLDLLRHRAKEIGDAEITLDEEDTLLEEQKLLGNAQQVLELAQASLQALDEAEPSAADLLASAQKSLESLSHLMPAATAWLEEARASAGAIRALAGAIRSETSRLESDPGRLNWLDERLSLYSKLRKKYGPTVADVMRVLETSRERLRDLESRDERLAEIRAEKERKIADLRRRALEIRAKREVAAKKMAGEITRELKDLGFRDGRFDVRLSEAPLNRTGLDHVEFEFGPNPGEPARALKAIASSGEIARVMLASKAVLAGHDQIPVLIFDEIDANVGGEMGTAIGRKLRQVAKHHQVISITHLPQVAVHGDRHFAVVKSVESGRTSTRVNVLEDETRTEEVARMLGGKDLTAVTTDHARALLRSAKG
jgi:DNA repair protein RecN (Recombination protein N)